MHTLGARDGSTHRVSLRQRLTAGVALSVAAASVVVVAASTPALANVSGVTVTPVRAAAGATTNYTVVFTTTVALTADVDTITLIGPAGTVFPASASAYTVHGTALAVAPTVTLSGTKVVMVTHASIAAGANSVTVIATGVVNPPQGSGLTMSAATSQETTNVASTAYNITAATAVTAVSASVVPAKEAATNAVYTIGFTAATSLLPAIDTITITGPAGTVFPLVAGDYTVNAGLATVTETATPTQPGGLNSVILLVPTGSAGGSAPTVITVVASGVTNPSTVIASTAENLTVSTSEDATAGTTTSTYAITATAVTAVSATPVPLNPAAIATYAIGFTATTALVAGVGTITIAGPTGTVFPASATDYTVGTGPATLVTLPPVRTNSNATVTITTPVGVAIGGATVTISAVTNPAASTPTLSVSTSGDTVPVASPTYTISGSAALQVNALTVGLSSTITGALSTYTVTFTAVTPLTSGSGTITLSAGGTTFPAGAYTVSDGTTAPVTIGAANTTVTFTTPVTVGASSVVTVVIPGVTNPAVGPHRLSVATSGDTTALASAFWSITAAPGGGAATTPATPVRLAGADRFGTAIAASLVEFPTTGSASAAVLARSDDYPDALVGTALAAARHAPLLFANGGALTPATVTEIQRVIPAGGTVYVLGGLAAVPASVATTLTSLGFVVVRYAGADRFGTALLVADALGDPSTVLLATGINFPDALAAGPAAAHLGGVVLLTNGTVLTAAVQAYLTAHPGTVYAIGGPAVTADPAATPLSGADRYGTAAAVATALFTGPNNVGVASGTQFPDALSGGAFQGHFGGPIVLTDPGVLPTPTSAYLSGAKTTVVTTSIFGGTAALSTAVQTSISTALGL